MCVWEFVSLLFLSLFPIGILNGWLSLYLYILRCIFPYSIRFKFCCYFLWNIFQLLAVVSSSFRLYLVYWECSRTSNVCLLNNSTNTIQACNTFKEKYRRKEMLNRQCTSILTIFDKQRYNMKKTITTISCICKYNSKTVIIITTSLFHLYHVFS